MYRRPWAAAILLACGSSQSAPAPIVVPTASVEAPPPAVPVGVVEPPPAPAKPEPPVEEELPETPPPPADFMTLGDAAKAGSKAIGKMVRIRVRRDHYTSATQFTGVPCLERPPNTSLWLRYKPEQRDWVRALHGTPPDACGTVSFKVVAFHGGPAPLVEGSIEHVGTLKPKKAKAPPAGAHYASIDDAILAGAEAKGKIIAADVWAYNGNPKELWVHDCKQHDAFLFVIPKTPDQQALAAQLSNTPGKCGSAHLLMADPDYVAKGGGESLKRPRADVVSVP